ncbi:uncharacterized protein LOC134287619 [Aedes albopictus]|uniref:CCHC-type domain-containing protein n=1 Tax=Aedes albopictus TaxID=7160 RepID=A0ABM1XK92_AEDAL
MDLELELHYKRLMVHHLEKHEIEHELAIRAVQFDPAETRSAIQRRLRDRLKEEKELDTLDLDFSRCNITIDNEIKIIDSNVEQIKAYLENEKRFEGLRDSLKSRLVHYFARVRRAQEHAETDEDLNDFDKLLSAIRGLINTHFSIFSPIQSVREDMLQEIVRSVSNLKLGAIPKTNQPKQGAERSHRNSKRKEKDNTSAGTSDGNEEELGAVGPVTSANRRVLKSFEQSSKPNLGALAALYPFGFPPYPMGWPQPDASTDANQSETVLRKFSLRKKSKSNPVQQVQTSESVTDSESTNSSASSDRPVVKAQRTRRRRDYHKSRPISEWNIKYDGRDNGQNLMKFIKEIEFYAKSENVSRRELFRSAIYFFKDQAKSWFMSGVENEDFGDWDELITELKREFLSPDHDHVNEIKAISRKQGPKERFSDYLSELQKIFNSLTKPISEGKKFEIVMRNLRSDYKGHAVASNINNLADLKRFGRQLDATYWYKYAPNAQDQPASRVKAQANEITREPRNKIQPPPEEPKRTYKSKSFYRSQKEHSEEEQPVNKPSRDTPKLTKQGNQQVRKSEESRAPPPWIDSYIPPVEGTCFNCRRRGHSHTECKAPRYKFCLRCGLHQVETKNCPFCAKNYQ